MLDIQRVEKKFLISQTAGRSLYGKLSKTLKEDIHNQNDGYLVRSLYFDTIFDDDFFDKDAGLMNRRKIRLRVYPPAFDVVKLELKAKNGSWQHKRSLLIEPQDAKAIIKGDYCVLAKYKEDLAGELYRIMKLEGYMSKCIVEYKRTAFMVPVNDVRITLDSYITANEGNYDLFSPSLPLYPVSHADDIILEVKYNGFLLSYIKDMMTLCDKTEISASKYCKARSMGHVTF